MFKQLLYSVLITVFSVTINGSYADDYDKLSLKNAITTALENSAKSKISQQSVEIAEAQYQQALSARWPTLSAQASFQRRDEAPRFIFPESNIPLGGLSGAISAALGGAPVPSSINVPQQSVKLFDRDTTIARLKAMYPVYTGGKVTSYIQQAGLNKAITQEEVRRTRLEIIRDVKRYYYAAQLTQRLHSTAKNTLHLLSDTRDLTKKLYEGGSETVNKLDYLKAEMAVSYARSVEQTFASKHQSALAALGNTMGVSWDKKLLLDNSFTPASVKNIELVTLIKQANAFNPQVDMLQLAIKVADAKIDEAISGYLPKIAITADTTHIDNDYDAGITNATNRNSWTIGIGIEIPIFDGWRTRSQVNQAKLEREQLQEKQKLLSQGIASQLKHLFIELDDANRQTAIAEDVSRIADENINLTSSAFKIGASKPKDLIESHILGAVMKASLYKAQHQQLLTMAEIEYVLGEQTRP